MCETPGATSVAEKNNNCARKVRFDAWNDKSNPVACALVRASIHPGPIWNRYTRIAQHGNCKESRSEQTQTERCIHETHDTER